MAMQKNMTMGNPFILLTGFVLPIFVGNLFQQLYLMSDTIIVSRLLGVDALAAVGAVSPFSFMVVGFAQGLTMGFTAILSQRFGAGDHEGMRKVYAMSTLLSIVISFLLTLIFTFLSRPMLKIVNTPENILDMAVEYISIIYIFLIFQVLYNLYSGVLRSLGDSKSPLIFMIISAITNIILDIVAIAVFHMGVGGAALATVISQGISALLCYIYIKKRFTILKPSKEEMKFDKSLSKVLLRVGLPGAFQYSITAISCILVQASLNNFGSDSVAAYSVASKIENMVTQFYPALGIGISTYAGQNLGAGELKRVRKGFRVSVYMNIIYSILALLLCRFFASPMTMIFIKGGSSETVIQESILYVHTMSLFFIPLGFIFIFRTGCQGLGSGKIPMLSAIIELVARTCTAFTLPYFFGFLGICLSNAVSWISAGFILPFVYLSFMKKLEGTNKEIANKLS